MKGILLRTTFGDDTLNSQSLIVSSENALKFKKIKKVIIREYILFIL
ncbi:MAG: hypothetical protein IGBAC_0713 [Ignavibacteriae bacterium]|nr:MAG: hypothetical protein IGBAC_0713 [Ignavibacteriota bacterium]